MARAPKKTEVEDTDDLPRYRVNERSFIGHALVDEGAEVTYEGDTVSDNLTPINDAAQAVVDAQTKPHLDKSEPVKGAKTLKARGDAAAAPPVPAKTGAAATDPGTDDAFA